MQACSQAAVAPSVSRPAVTMSVSATRDGGEAELAEFGHGAGAFPFQPARAMIDAVHDGVYALRDEGMCGHDSRRSDGTPCKLHELRCASPLPEWYRRMGDILSGIWQDCFFLRRWGGTEETELCPT